MSRMDQSTAQRMLEQLAGVLPSRGRVYVIPHDDPDPDALASAAGMHLLLAKRFRLNGQILFSGEVSRAENQELLKQFRYPWSLVHQESRPRHSLPAILVDTSPWTGNVTLPDYVRPVAVFDHHPLSRKYHSRKGLAVDNRAEAGATCTMVYEYLQICGIAIPKWLATVLAYAIASETLDLSRESTEEDLQAYESLLAHSNLSTLGRIRHAPLPRAYFRTLREAMVNARVLGRLAWTHLGGTEHREFVAEIADMLHRMERITWAYCTAYRNGQLLISIRSSDPRARCGRLLQEVIGGNGNAGGHHHMAAGYMDVSDLSADDREALRETLVRELAQRIDRRLSRRDRDHPGAVRPQPLA